MAQPQGAAAAQPPNLLRLWTAWVPLLAPLAVPLIHHLAVLKSRPVCHPELIIHADLICYGFAFDVWAVSVLLVGHYLAGGGIWHVADDAPRYPEVPQRLVVDPREVALLFAAVFIHSALIVAAVQLTALTPKSVIWVFFGTVAPCVYLVMRRPYGLQVGGAMLL